MNEELKFTQTILHGARLSYRRLLGVALSEKESTLIELSDQHDELGAVEEVRYICICMLQILNYIFLSC